MYMQLEYESKGGISWLLFFKFQNSFFPWLRNFKRITFSLQFKKLCRLSHNNLFINSLLPHPGKKEGGEKKKRETNLFIMWGSSINYLCGGYYWGQAVPIAFCNNSKWHWYFQKRKSDTLMQIAKVPRWDVNYHSEIDSSYWFTSYDINENRLLYIPKN